MSMDFFLFFLRKIFQLNALLEPPSLLISEKSAPNNKYEKNPPPCPYLNLHVYLILAIFPSYTF